MQMRFALSIASFFLLLTHSGGPLFAQPDNQVCDKYTGGERELCVKLTAYDALLNGYYQSLVTTLLRSELAGLRDEQRKWLKARDQKCGIERFPTERAGWFEALTKDDTKAKCVIDLTSQRFEFLVGQSATTSSDEDDPTGEPQRQPEQFLTCDPKRSLAIIAGNYEDIDSYEKRDCVFANGRTIRVKTGVGPAYPYGMGGGTPDIWLSVWIDKRKAISKALLTCGALYICNRKVVVADSGYGLCQQDTPENSHGTRLPGWRCEFHLNEEITDGRDKLEYPEGREPSPPKAGSILTVYAKDRILCDRFQKLDRASSESKANFGWFVMPPIDSERVDPEKTVEYEYAGHYEHFVVDINNDGKRDNVVALFSRNHYRDGDVYFVYETASPPSVVIDTKTRDTNSELAYAEAAKYIYPSQWNTDPNGPRDIDDGLYVFQNYSSPWWDVGDKAAFRMRYWNLLLFRDKNKTYFLAGSMEGAKSHWYAVLRPEPTGKVTEMCLFHQVRERY